VASRKDEKEQRRAERLARESEQAEAARKRRLYSVIVGAILGLAAIAAVAVAVTSGGSDGDGHSGGVPSGKGSYDGAADPPPQQETDLVRAARAADCRLSNPVIEGRTHIDADTKVTYKTNPPTSGNHDPQPAADGVYDDPVSARDLRHLVHTLEHGRIEIHYDPALRKRDVDRLGGLFNEDPYHMALLPNARMKDYEVAATAWGHLVGCKTLEDRTFDVLRAFRDRYRDQGPEQAP
jgi:hypothetical protein